MNNLEFLKLKNLCSTLNAVYIENYKQPIKTQLDFFNYFFNSVKHVSVKHVLANNKNELLTDLEFLSKTLYIDIIFYDLSLVSSFNIKALINFKEKNKNIILIGLTEEVENKHKKFKKGLEAQISKVFSLKEFYEIIFLEIKKHKQKLQECNDCLSIYSLNKNIVEKKYEYIALFDIKNFSIINRLYGREFGDKVILKVASLLKENESLFHKHYKIDSDKYVFLLKGDSVNDIEKFISSISLQFQEKLIEIEDKELDISFNVGVAKMNYDNQDLISAEYALQQAKEIDNSFYFFYDSENKDIIAEKELINWFNTTKKIIKEKHIYPYFQPIKNINTNEIIKYEVLARGLFNNEIIPPMFFISVAEKLGIASDITKIIIEKSFSFFQNKNFEFSINICAQDLISGYLPVFLKNCLSKYNINPKLVTFEILENIAISENNQNIISQINILKLLGFNIAIDDFGSDNSNFSRFLDIDCDILKIDRLFIKNIASNEKHKIIVKTMVELAKSLNIKTVAEYVENEEIYNIVKECGVDYAQGYYIGKPENYTL